MSSPAVHFATPRVAAGALFVRDASILLVRKTYGNRWDLPGGYVDRGESPASACIREVREEIGIDSKPIRLLVNDWAPSETEGDKLLYIFYCGELSREQHSITLDGVEIDHWEWVPVSRLESYVIPRLHRRLRSTFEAYETNCFLYLEHGRPVL